MDKRPILQKLNKRYGIYNSADSGAKYTELPDTVGRTDFPMQLYDFGKNKVITVKNWTEMYGLSLKM